MNTEEEKILADVRTDHPYVVALRRYFHAHPELSRHEENTARRIEQELDQIGIAHQRLGEHCVSGEIRGSRPGNGVIVLRADIDALPIQEEHACKYQSQMPGIMHACGHDAHAAALIGAARILSQNRSLFAGTVRLAFQEAEEVGYGGRIIADSDLLAGADRTFGIHMASNVPVGSVVAMPGPNNASVDWFRIRVHGLSAHVSTPEQGVDAAYIAAQIAVAVQALVTRRTSPMAPALIGIGRIQAGTAYNIIASSAELEGTIRVMTPELRAQLKAQLQNLAQSTAESFGGTAEVEYKDFTSPLINDPAATAEVQKTAAALFGSGHVICRREPSLSGDDMAELILKVPGCYAYVGSGNPARPETVAAHHNSHFDIDEDALQTAVALYAAYAADYLNSVRR